MQHVHRHSLIMISFDDFLDAFSHLYNSSISLSIRLSDCLSVCQFVHRSVSWPVKHDLNFKEIE